MGGPRGFTFAGEPKPRLRGAAWFAFIFSRQPLGQSGLRKKAAPLLLQGQRRLGLKKPRSPAFPTGSCTLLSQRSSELTVTTDGVFLSHRVVWFLQTLRPRLGEVPSSSGGRLSSASPQRSSWPLSPARIPSWTALVPQPRVLPLAQKCVLFHLRA